MHVTSSPRAVCRRFTAVSFAVIQSFVAVVLLVGQTGPGRAQDASAWTRGAVVSRGEAELTFDLPAGFAPSRVLNDPPPTDRIIGGVPATRGQWTSMVGVIFVNEKKNEVILCGGTIIARDWVLTAAHCLADTLAKDKDFIGIVIEGTTELAPKAGHQIRVDRFFIEPNYSATTHLNDVALLHLDGNAQSPAQKLVGKDGFDAIVHPQEKATVIGFGTTAENGQASMNLRQVDIPIVPRDACRTVYGPDAITEANFCAGYQTGGKDSCQGDSGGPLYVTDKAGQKVQAGVVSYGNGCARANAYGVYASVGNFEPWIRSHVPNPEFLAVPSGGSVPSPAEQAAESLTPGAQSSDHPSALAQVTLDIPQGRKLRAGTYIVVRVASSVAGQVVVFNDNPDGHSYQLYPSKVFPASGNEPFSAHIQPGKVLTIPSAQQLDRGFRFIVRPPYGVNHLRAVVLPEGKAAAEAIRQHADGADIPNLGSVMANLVSAEEHDRGIEVIKVPETDKGSADLEYEIVP